MLHLNLSHASQPMGGVRANPFSNPCTPTLMASAPNTAATSPPVILEKTLYGVLGCAKVAATLSTEGIRRRGIVTQNRIT